MYNNEKIGVGIITCNRKDTFNQLYKYVLNNSDVDFICVVKNKDYDYGDIFNNIPTNVKYINILDDINIAYYKNTALRNLMEQKCDHLFLIEDDTIIKNNNVFKKYIDTAKSFKLHHLNFSMSWDSITKRYLTPQYLIKKSENEVLSIANRLGGSFAYFTLYVVQQIGLFNDRHYINVLEHVEHTYRIAISEYTTPFFAFADIENANEYLEDVGIESNINRDEKLYQERLTRGYNYFIHTYGKSIGQIHIPTIEEVKHYLTYIQQYEI